MARLDCHRQSQRRVMLAERGAGVGGQRQAQILAFVDLGDVHGINGDRPLFIGAVAFRQRNHALLVRDGTLLFGLISLVKGEEA